MLRAAAWIWATEKSHNIKNMDDSVVVVGVGVGTGVVVGMVEVVV